MSERPVGDPACAERPEQRRERARRDLRQQALALEQRLVPRIPPRLLDPMVKLLGNKRLVEWSFGHYLRIAHPSFARSPRELAAAAVELSAAA